MSPRVSIYLEERLPMLDELMQRVISAPLSKNELLTIATQLQSHPVRVAARELFRALKKAASSETTANIFSLFRELLTREPAWKRVLGRSVEKRGRCPAHLRPALKQLLRDDADRAAFEVEDLADVLSAGVFTNLETVVEEQRAPRFALPHAQHRLRKSLFRKNRTVLTLTTELTDILHMEELASLLYHVKLPVDELILDFAGVEHTYVVGLAAIKAWCEQHQLRLTLKMPRTGPSAIWTWWASADQSSKSG